MGGRYSSIISPPDRVAIDDRHVPSCMSFLTKRTPPSQKGRLRRPACPLRCDQPFLLLHIHAIPHPECVWREIVVVERVDRSSPKSTWHCARHSTSRRPRSNRLASDRLLGCVRGSVARPVPPCPGQAFARRMPQSLNCHRSGRKTRLPSREEDAIGRGEATEVHEAAASVRGIAGRAVGRAWHPSPTGSGGTQEGSHCSCGRWVFIQPS